MICVYATRVYESCTLCDSWAGEAVPRNDLAKDDVYRDVRGIVLPGEHYLSELPPSERSRTR